MKPAGRTIASGIAAAACAAALFAGEGLEAPAAGSAGAPAKRRAAPAVSAVIAHAKPGRVRVGDLVTVEIAARGVEGAGAVSFHLVFDPARLEPVTDRFFEGGWLRRDGASTAFLARAASSGDRVMVGITRLGAYRGARGSGTLCRLTFRARAPGSTAFLFDRAVLSAPDASRTQTRFVPARVIIEPAKEKSP